MRSALFASLSLSLFLFFVLLHLDQLSTAANLASQQELLHWQALCDAVGIQREL